MSKAYVPLAGSERRVLAGARYLSAVNPNERIEVSVYVRPRAQPRERITREEYASRYGAHDDDLERVRQFAKDCNLTVQATEKVSGLVVLAGTAAAMSKAFRTELHYWQVNGRTYRGRSGALHVPEDLASVIGGVFGLDDRPQAESHKALFDPRLGSAAPHTAPEVATLYNFPTYGNGQGQCIGIIELGGGFQQQDLQIHFSRLGLAVPPVFAVSVDGGTNAPDGNPGGDDGEVMLDIEVAGAVANGATIAVYFAPNSERGFIDAVTAAAFDQVHRPSVLSISWGAPEGFWTDQGMTAMDQAFQTAAAFGVTVFCSSGDDGSNDRVGDGLAHADFPASSPNAVACGGTHLESIGSAITSEVVWNDNIGASGGGISDFFALPAYQAAAGTPPSVNGNGHIGRGVPDIAGDAAPETGYPTRVDGAEVVFGGTSAVSPLWAGLMALINEQLAEPVGFVNPALYQEFIFEADVTRDITSGNNGGYPAGAGWDACTGFGTPNGENWLAALIF